jgi:hypothetical protein
VIRMPKAPTWKTRFLPGLAVGLALFWFSYLLDYILARMGISAADTLMNNYAIGILGVIAAYLWVRYEAERQARAREKLILAIELNHHIRNALATISQCASIQDEQTKYQLIDAAIERIDRVLTELVPTADQASSPRFFLDHPSELGPLSPEPGVRGPRNS